MLNIRLKYSEDIFREKIEELGRKVEAPVKLVDFVLDENAEDEWKVTATCARPDGSTYKVKSKYIVGADGGSSAVRKSAGKLICWVVAALLQQLNVDAATTRTSETTFERYVNSRMTASKASVSDFIFELILDKVDISSIVDNSLLESGRR